MKQPVLPARAQATLAGACDAFRTLLSPALDALPAQVSQRLVQQAEQTRDFSRYEAVLHAEREISRNDRALQQGFIRHLTSLLARSIATAYADYRPSIHDVPANATLRLVDTVEVEDNVLLMQIAAEYRRQAGAALQELDVRIANLFGQGAVRERENPFRPYLIAKSIALAVADTPVARDKLLSVTQHLAMGLADQADGIYRQVNELLQAAGVPADLPVTAPTAPARAPVRPAGAMTDAAPASVQDMAAATPGAAPGASAGRAGQAGSGPTGSGASGAAGMRAGMAQGGLHADHGRAGDAPPAEPPRPSGLAGARQRLQQRLAQWAAQAGAASAEVARGADAARGDALRGAGPSTMHVGADETLSGMPGSAAGVDGRRVMPMLKQFLTSISRAQQDAAQGPPLSTSATGAASAQARHAAQPAHSAQPARSDIPAQQRQGDQGAEGALATFLRSPAALASPMADDPRLRAEPIPNLIFEHRDELERHSTAAEELITIDVVGMLFEFILLDQSVPAAIRAQIGRLQYYLLQVALAEPALMTESGHPARRLVNRIGTASLSAEDKPEAMSLVTGHVRELVDTLLADTRYRPDILDSQLARFERFMREIVRTQHVASQHDTQRLIDSLEAASQQVLRRERLVAGVGEVAGTLAVPDFVRQFLVGHWIDVIATAGTPQDAVRWREVVPLLTWSVLPKDSRAMRQQLLSALGNLVRELKAGLQQAGITTEADRFFRHLMRAHRTLVGDTGEDARAMSLNAVRAAFDPVLRVQFMAPAPVDADADAAQADGAAPGPAVLPQLDYLGAISRTGAGVVEARQAGAALPIEPDESDELDLAASGPGTADGATTRGDSGSGLASHHEAYGNNAAAPLSTTGDSVDLVRNRLGTGAEVEIDLDGTIQRGMLVWADSKVKTMLLSFGNGRRPVAVSVRLFRVLLGKGRARFLEAEPLFDRAVLAVLQEAQAQQRAQPGSA